MNSRLLTRFEPLRPKHLPREWHGTFRVRWDERTGTIFVGADRDGNDRMRLSIFCQEGTPLAAALRTLPARLDVKAAVVARLHLVGKHCPVRFLEFKPWE